MPHTLYYFPITPREWLGNEGVSMMLPEQEGALFRLVCIMWGDGTAEPSLPADDAALAQMSRLGARWKKFGPVIRAQFSERDGRLYHPQLSATWQAKQTAYTARAAAGRRGGEAKAKRQRGSSNAKPLPQQSELEGEVEQSLTALALPSPAPSGAFALGEAPRAGGAETDDERAMQAEYYQRLRERGALWIDKHPDEAAQLEVDARVEMALPHGRELTPWQQQFLRDHVLDVIRERHGWPDCEQWIAEEVRKRLDTIPATNGATDA